MARHYKMPIKMLKNLIAERNFRRSFFYSTDKLKYDKETLYDYEQKLKNKRRKYGKK